jgi:hypothetical protein
MIKYAQSHFFFNISKSVTIYGKFCGKETLCFIFRHYVSSTPPPTPTPLQYEFMRLKWAQTYTYTSVHKCDMSCYFYPIQTKTKLVQQFFVKDLTSTPDQLFSTCCIRTDETPSMLQHNDTDAGGE